MFEIRLKQVQKMPKAKTPQKGTNMFFISTTEYSAMPIIRGTKKKKENGFKSVARQVQREASNSFIFMFFLFFKLMILRKESSMQKFESSAKGDSKL